MRGFKLKSGDFLKKTRKIEENSLKNSEIDLKIAISRLKSIKFEEFVSQEDFEKKFGVKLDEVEPLKDEEIE